MTSTRTAPRWVTALAVLLAIACLVAGIVYFVDSADALPSFFPGHLSGSAHHHVKHGVAAIILGLVLLAVAWMTTGSRDDAPSTPAAAEPDTGQKG